MCSDNLETLYVILTIVMIARERRKRDKMETERYLDLIFVYSLWDFVERDTQVGVSGRFEFFLVLQLMPINPVFAVKLISNMYRVIYITDQSNRSKYIEYSNIYIIDSVIFRATILKNSEIKFLFNFA